MSYACRARTLQIVLWLVLCPHYAGVLIPGGAKSPALLAESARIRDFVKRTSEGGNMIASICRGSLLPAKSDVVHGKRMTGFNDAALYPDLVVQPHAEAAGADLGRPTGRR